jgi:hypothetical protein
LRDREDNNEAAKAHKEANDARIIPLIGGATPLQGKEEADDARDEDEGAKKIKFPDAGEKGLAA